MTKLLGALNGLKLYHVEFHCEATPHPQKDTDTCAPGPKVYFHSTLDPPVDESTLPPSVMQFYEEVKTFPFIRITHTLQICQETPRYTITNTTWFRWLEKDVSNPNANEQWNKFDAAQILGRWNKKYLM